MRFRILNIRYAFLNPQSRIGDSIRPPLYRSDILAFRRGSLSGAARAVVGCVEAHALRFRLRTRRRRSRGLRKGTAGVRCRCGRRAGVVHLAFPSQFGCAPLLLLASAVSLPCCARGCDTSAPLRRCKFLKALPYWRARARHRHGPLFVGANSQ